MSKRGKTLEQRFPDKKAREKADEAIDPLPIEEPMVVFCKVWIEAYEAAGGRVVL